MWKEGGGGMKLAMSSLVCMSNQTLPLELLSRGSKPCFTCSPWPGAYLCMQQGETESSQSVTG